MIEKLAEDLGYSVTYDNRDTAYITVEGQDPSKTVCISSHADTLGFMVRAIKGGNNLRAALIGMGVYASHGVERTHIKGVENTAKLVLGYILGKE